MRALYTTQIEASEGLDVCGYAGKWTAAKLYVGQQLPVNHSRYWTSVRTHFLALGGIYTNQKCHS